MIYHLMKNRGNNMEEERLLKVMNGIREVLGFGSHPFTKKELENFRMDFSKMKIGKSFETGCFKFTKRKNYYEISLSQTFRMKKEPETKRLNL